MANFNKVMLIGRLTRDPELRYTPQGSAVCDFTLAITRFYTTPNGEKKEESCFVDIVTWKRQAELCAEYLKKGRTVFIEGRLTLDKWETPEGQKRSRLKVTAQTIQFLGARSPAAAPAEGGLPHENVGEPEPSVNEETAREEDIPF